MRTNRKQPLYALMQPVVWLFVASVFSCTVAVAQVPRPPTLLVDADTPLIPAITAEYVDSDGVRRNVAVTSGQTTISGVAPFLVSFDASGTRANRAFSEQNSIDDPEAYAFLSVGYRLHYGENIGGSWRYPAGANASRDEDTGPPIFSRVYRNPGNYQARLRVRDTLGNERTMSFVVSVAPAPAATPINVSDGRWPGFSSGRRYTLQAGGDYRAFGTLELGGLHNVIIEKVGTGADPRISVLSPDGRSKFSATRQFEPRGSHLRLVNVDIGEFMEGQRGFDYVGVIGGVVRRYTYGGQDVFWHEGTAVTKSNVRYSRGFFLEGTEIRSSAAGSGYVIFGNFRGLNVRDTRIVHLENGPTSWAMLRLYGSYYQFRNNLWTSPTDGGSGNGILTSFMSMGGRSETRWRDDDAPGPISSSDNSEKYGYVGEKQIVQNNQMYDANSFFTNAIASVGGGNPVGAMLVRPRLVGWEDNVFFPAAPVARLIQHAELRGRHAFWRNNRTQMGTGSFISAVSIAPNASVGDLTTYNGPHLVEQQNSRPSPSPF